MEDLLTTDACTMPTADRAVRLAELDDLFASAARSVTWADAGVRIHLVGSTDLRDRVRELIARETDCCSFFRFVVEGREDDLTLHIAVPPERRAVLEALADRAERAVP